jgi:hypothetical protein
MSGETALPHALVPDLELETAGELN